MTGMERPYYDILGVRIDARPAEIKAAYRALVKTMHPDAGGDPVAFVELNSAYTVLSDPKLRADYDMLGSTPDFDAIKFAESVILTLAASLDAILNDIVGMGIDIDKIDMIGEFKRRMAPNLDNFRASVDKMTKKLISYQKLRDRIRRSGEERNLFVESIDRQIKNLSMDLIKAKKDQKVADRVWEMLAEYHDAVAFMRTVNAARYPGQRGMSTNSTNGGHINFFTGGY